MTDAVAAAPSAASASPSTPIEPADTAPTPLSNEAPAAEAKEAPKEMPSTRDALRAAAAKVEARIAGDGKEGEKSDAARGADGKFAAKEAKGGDKPDEGAPSKDVPAATKSAPPVAPEKPAAAEAAPAPKRTVAAPERFSSDAKAVWDTAPEPVKAEVDRMHREMNAGIEKYRAGADAFEQVRRFDDMAKASGKRLSSVIEDFVNMEQLLRANPLQGLETLCGRMGTSLRDVAQIVMGQKPEEVQSRSDARIRQLEQQIERLTGQLGGVTRTFEEQHTRGLQRQIEDWATDRPLFDVIAPHIAEELRGGAATLDEAEERVFQKYPQLAALAKAPDKPAAKDQKPAASSAAEPDLSAQTEKGSKSITGAPGGGSEPAKRQASNSIKEALKRAAARAG